MGFTFPAVRTRWFLVFKSKRLKRCIGGPVESITNIILIIFIVKFNSTNGCKFYTVLDFNNAHI